MAFPPILPTSFVPHSASTPFRQISLDFSGAVTYLCYGVFVAMLLLAGAVFGYHWYLLGIETAKSAELEQAKAAIDTTMTDSFIALSNRLTESKQHLNSHIAFSNLFNVLELLEPTTVRLHSLQLNFTEGNDAILTAGGVAASFNALASLSQILGKDGRLKNAIFSGLTINKTGVSFALTATAEPSLVAFTLDSVQPAAASLPLTSSSTPPQP